MPIIIDRLIEIAKQTPKRIILPEGTEERTMRAAVRAQQEGLAIPILVGEEDEIKQAAQQLNLNIDGVEISTPSQSPFKQKLEEMLFDLRKHKGMTKEHAAELVLDPVMHGNLMVRAGYADGTVAGAISTTADVEHVAFQVLGTKPGAKLISSFFIIVMDQPHHPRQATVLFSDCALIIDPDSAALAEIALQTAESSRTLLNQEPKVAMLSFSTNRSAKHPMVDKVADATDIVRERQPDLKIDGEIQFDAAIIPAIAKTKLKDSTVKGEANVFIFPSLEAANIGAKIAERIGGAKAIGPIIQGLAYPANDLSRGCSASDIFDTIAITAVQAIQQ